MCLQGHLHGRSNKISLSRHQRYRQGRKMLPVVMDVLTVPRFWDLRTFLSVLLGFFGALCLLLWLKFVVKRHRIAQLFPGLLLRSSDVLGHLKNLPSKQNWDKHGYNISLLQLFSAHTQLFRDKQIFCFWLSYEPFFVFVGAKAVEELISGTKVMEKAWQYKMLHPWLGTGLLTSSGSKWKSRRKLLTPSFHFEILKDFLPIFDEQSQLLVQILDKETSKPWIDIVQPITMCSLDIICETTLGTSVNAQTSESEYVKAVLRTSNIIMEKMMDPTKWVDWLFYLTKDGRQLKKDLNVLHTFTTTVIRDKKSNLLSGDLGATEGKKRKALMDLLLDHHIRSHDISEEDIREEVDTFAFEGHDTTSLGMSWALYLIGLHQDIQAKIYEELHSVFGEDTSRYVTMDDIKELKYMECVLKESQRLYPSVPMFGRQTNEDVTICGHTIPKGSACNIFTYQLHRDETFFPNPEKFDPDRFLPENSLNRPPFAYIPFSAGPRNCIGQRFAMLEEKTVIANVLRNFHLQSLEHRDLIQAVPELILRPSGPLKISLTRRHSKCN